MEISALTAPVPKQNARRGLFQLTNRNQTHEEWGLFRCTAPEGTAGEEVGSQVGEKNRKESKKELGR